MRCNYCGNQVENDVKECALCGTPVPVSDQSVFRFGRGHPTALFDWMFKYLPYIYVVSIVYTFASLYHILVNLYRGNVALFVSIVANAIFINMRLANVVFMLVIIYFSFSKNRVNFGRFFIYKHILQIVELIILLLAGGAQIGLVDGLVETFIREMFFNLVVFIPAYNYLNKRMTIFGFGEQ